MSNDEQAGCIIVPKTISLVACTALLSFLLGAAWWAADLSARIQSVEREQARYQRVLQDLQELKTDVRWIKKRLGP